MMLQNECTIYCRLFKSSQQKCSFPPGDVECSQLYKHREEILPRTSIFLLSLSFIPGLQNIWEKKCVFHMFSQHVLQTRSDQYDFVNISVIEGCVPVLFPSAATIVVNASVFT